jgi:hypothetical protein
MHAAMDRIAEKARDSIGGDAGITQEATVGCARGHGRNYRDAGKHLCGKRFHMMQDLRIDWGGRAQHPGTLGSDLDPLVAKHARKRARDVFDGLVGKDAAIHRGAGCLRQRVFGMARGELGRNAGSPDLRIVVRTQRQPASMALMASAIGGVSAGAIRSKKARVTALSLTGKSNWPSRRKPSART